MLIPSYIVAIAAPAINERRYVPPFASFDHCLCSGEAGPRHHQKSCGFWRLRPVLVSVEYLSLPAQRLVLTGSRTHLLAYNGSFTSTRKEG